MAAVMEVTELLCVKSFVLARLLLSCLWLFGPEPSMAPLEWPGKVLSNLVRASGAQPGCYWLPESLSICLNA